MKYNRKELSKFDGKDVKLVTRYDGTIEGKMTVKGKDSFGLFIYSIFDGWRSTEFLAEDVVSIELLGALK